MAIETKQIYLRDGRHAEEKVTKEDGVKTVELYAEPERQLHLASRVVEKTKPVVYERIVETIKDGNVIETKVESTEPEVRTELRRHIIHEYENEAPPEDVEQKRSMISSPKKRSAQEEIEEKIESQKKDKILVIALMGVIAAQVAALGYLYFLT